MTRKSSKVISILSYLIIVILLVGVCGMVAYFTNGFTSDFKTFYIAVDGKDVLANSSGYVMTVDSATDIDVKYTFESVNDDISGYSVKVYANTDKENDFTFTIDGETHNFSNETDLSKGFEIVESEKSFTIKPKGTINEILSSVYNGQEVSNCDEYMYEDMFVMTVTSYNGESSITIKFSVYSTQSGITLDKEVIVF